MNTLPKELIEAWKHREGPVVFTTVDANEMPNSIYATCVGLSADGKLVVADNYFFKTKKNIDRGTSASLLFMTDEGKAYQLKGDVAYHTSGTFFDFMKSWNPKELPGRGAAAITIREVHTGASRIL